MDALRPTVSEMLVAVAKQVAAFIGIATTMAIVPGLLLASVLIWLAIRLANNSQDQRFARHPSEAP
jgi:hypothetical protein